MIRKAIVVRRNRLRRVMKWVGLFACFTFLVGWCLSIYGYVEVDYGRFTVIAQCGGVQVVQQRGPHFHVTRLKHGWFQNSCLWLVPHAMSTASMKVWLFVPFWIPFLAFAIPTVILWRRDRRFPPGHCQKCGYDLTGNESGLCPECGKQVGSRESFGAEPTMRK